MIRILIVEDERSISNLIEINLKKAGYHCECVFDAANDTAQVYRISHARRYVYQKNKKH